MHRGSRWLLGALLCASACAQAARPLEPEDWYGFESVSDLQLAPDGASIAYLVTRYEREGDASRASLWTAPWAGGEPRQLTRGEGVGSPRYSPDGRYLSFTSSRPADAPAQLWLLDRAGGEPAQASHVKGELQGYEWSPDGRHVVLVVRDPAPAGGEADGKETKSPHPIVIDAFRFKQDIEGYRGAGQRDHLWLLDVASGEAVQLTADAAVDDGAPEFSPDGRRIAYVAHRDARQEDLGRDEIRIVDATAGAGPRSLATVDAPNGQHLAWSPDGRQIALLVGDVPKMSAYLQDRLALLDAAGGTPRVLTGALDRAVAAPRWAADGRSLLVIVEDDGYRWPARVDAASGQVAPLGERMVVNELAMAAGHVAVVAATDATPRNAYALEGGVLRALTRHSVAQFAGIALGSVEDVRFHAKDGTEVHGQVVKPVGYVPGRRYPAIVWIHGGPNGQDEHALELEGYCPPLERQLFAGHGYVVLAVNYRGSSGRGAAYARAIVADWGHHEVEDLLSGADWLVAQGLADPKRLGIGGWSYGGILTDYTIATDPRFAAAISGAGSANQLSMYGMDQYVMQYNAELGPPWKSQALWLKLSYPFFHADRIRTPTLFMGGIADFNVPIAGGEQMYQSLRTLGVPTQLVAYPGEFHVFARPSFLVDRWQRFLGWMDRYLGAPATP